MAVLLTLPITTALSGSGFVSPTRQAREKHARNLAVQAALAYGSGGTSIDAYLQTSFDDAASWWDIANFHFTTAALVHLINLSSMTPVTTPVVPVSGSLAANTAIDGLLGDLLRVVVKSAGTYAGGTVLTISTASASRLEKQP